MENSILNNKVRRSIYAVAGIVNLVSIYLAAVGVLGIAEVTLVNGINAFICTLAGFNVPTKGR